MKDFVDYFEVRIDVALLPYEHLIRFDLLPSEHDERHGDHC
jgi:hypothetical protein